MNISPDGTRPHKLGDPDLHDLTASADELGITYGEDAEVSQAAAPERIRASGRCSVHDDNSEECALSLLAGEIAEGCIQGIAPDHEATQPAKFDLTKYLDAVEAFFGSEALKFEYRAARLDRRKDNVARLRKMYLEINAIRRASDDAPGKLKRRYLLACMRYGIAAPLIDSGHPFPDEVKQPMELHAKSYASAYAKSYALSCLYEDAELSVDELAERVESEVNKRPEILRWTRERGTEYKKDAVTLSRLPVWAARSALSDFDPEIARAVRARNSKAGRKAGARRTAKMNQEIRNWLEWRKPTFESNFDNHLILSEVRKWNLDHPEGKLMTERKLRDWYRRAKDVKS